MYRKSTDIQNHNLISVGCIYCTRNLLQFFCNVRTLAALAFDSDLQLLYFRCLKKSSRLLSAFMSKNTCRVACSDWFKHKAFSQATVRCVLDTRVIPTRILNILVKVSKVTSSCPLAICFYSMPGSLGISLCICSHDQLVLWYLGFISHSCSTTFLIQLEIGI